MIGDLSCLDRIFAKTKISLQNCLQKAMHYTYLRTIEQLQTQVVVRSLKRDLGMVGGTHF
jgi:hypothetical protein